jgi:signal transduction histidine kinase
MAYLEILSGYNIGQRIELIEETRVGRASDNDLCLLDPSVSRYHALISPYRHGFILQDLHSSNGTKLRQTLLPPDLLQGLLPGDLIEFGNTQLRYHTDSINTPQANQAESPCKDRNDSQPYSQTKMMPLCQLGDAETTMVIASLDATQALNYLDANEPYSNQTMQEMTRRLQAMCQINLAVSTITDLDSLLHKIVDCVYTLFAGCGRVFILLQSPQSEILVPVAIKISDHQPYPREALRLSETVVHQVLRSRRAILSQDTASDDRFKAQDSIINLSIRSVMCAPLLVDDAVIGLVQVDAIGDPQKFTESDLHLLSGLIAQVATAVKQAQLLKQLAEANTALKREDAKRRLAETSSSKAQAEAEKARLANAAKSEFLANMSHELRTPLHAILSYAQFGLSKLETSALGKLHKYFDQIERQGHHLLNLVNELLDLAKFEAGKMTFNYGMVNLAKLLKQIGEECQALSDARHLSITYNLPSTSRDVLSDAAKIQQVVRNLFSNAIKFTPEGGTITVALHYDTQGAIVTVLDQGPGVPDAELETIFDKFVQSSLTKTGAGGTGLGLAICHEIIASHQGRIWAENHPAGGAKFTFVLPWREPHQLGDSHG